MDDFRIVVVVGVVAAVAVVAAVVAVPIYWVWHDQSIQDLKVTTVAQPEAMELILLRVRPLTGRTHQKTADLFQKWAG